MRGPTLFAVTTLLAAGRVANVVEIGEQRAPGM